MKTSELKMVAALLIRLTRPKELIFLLHTFRLVVFNQFEHLKFQFEVPLRVIQIIIGVNFNNPECFTSTISIKKMVALKLAETIIVKIFVVVNIQIVFHMIQ